MRLTTLRIAWRNLGRNRKRTIFAVAAIALGQLTLVAVNGLMAGMYEEMLQTITGPLIGHVQIYHKDWREEQAIDLYIDHVAETLRRIEAIPAVKSVSPRIYAPVLAAQGERSDEPADAEAAMIVGLDVAVCRAARALSSAACWPTGSASAWASRSP
jgi:ABC-type lipoprotein release transport system permease subunit